MIIVAAAAVMSKKVSIYDDLHSVSSNANVDIKKTIFTLIDYLKLPRCM